MSLLQMLMGVTGTTGGGGGSPPFTPTYLARQSATSTPTVEAVGESYRPSPTSGLAETWLWIETTASETYVRLDANASGNLISTEEWWNPSDVSQGAPGVDEDALTLGARVDSVNIYTANYTQVVSGADMIMVKQGTFTDDDKITFFNPTNGVNYGWKLEASASDPGGDRTLIGYANIQFTFRKAGFADLTVTYCMATSADAEYDP